MGAPSPAALTRRLQRLDAAGLTTDEYCRAVCDELGRAVPFAFGCLATADPATGLITGAVKTADTGMGDEEFAYYEYAVDDINQFDEIARRPLPVGILSVDTGGHLEASTRWRELMAPRFGFTDELRLAFRSGQRTWGVLAVYRTGHTPFRAADADLLLAAVEPVALGIRRSLFGEAAVAGDAPDGPAVLVVGGDDRVAKLSPAGQRRIADLGGLDHGSLPTNILALLNAARRGGFPSVRLRAGGGWLVARAAALDAGDGPATDVVITIDPAGPGDLTPLALAAFGLTAREEEVARLVLQGTATPAIAATLYLSPHTVQDHLKRVFAKVGVSSRRELIAKVFFGYHAAHLDRGRRTDGSLRTTPLADPAGR